MADTNRDGAGCVPRDAEHVPAVGVDAQRTVTDPDLFSRLHAGDDELPLGGTIGERRRERGYDSGR